MIVAGTGHRPDKLGGYDHKTFDRLVVVAARWLEEQETKQVGSIEYVISGMALGWDQAIAQASIELRIPFDAYIPFKGQELRWPRTSQQFYYALMSSARHVKIVSSGGYAGWKMNKRNEAMVDMCTDVLALWNGQQSGGTANCIRYAELRKRPIHNQWERFVGQP